jgi:hypothetical protein
MWFYLFTQTKRQKVRSALISGGFLLVACALILLSATTLTTGVRVQQEINQNWRPAYDLLVLPAQAKIGTGLVIAPDTFEAYNGGISISQYQQLRKLSGIAVAAPVAFLGYVQLPVPSIFFQPDGHPLPPGYYQLDWTLTSFDGQHNIVEQQQQVFFHQVTPSECAPSGATIMNSATINLLCGNSPVFQGAMSSQQSQTYASPYLLNTGTFLLAAIDPTEENQLVHLKNYTQGGMLAPGQSISARAGSSVNQPMYNVPILVNSHLPGRIMLQAHLSRVETPQNSNVAAQGGVAYLKGMPEQTIFHGTIPVSQNDPHNFTGHALDWNGTSWQATASPPPGYAGSLLTYTPSGLTYQATRSPTGTNEPAYTLVPVAAQGNEPVFRTIHPYPFASIGQGSIPPYYFIQPVGTYNGEELATQFSNALNWLPDSTYAAAPTILRYDTSGQAVKPVQLLPTTNDAGFLLQPPLALTTLTVAQQLKGNNCISMIRVRLSGSIRADQQGWLHISQVAQEIRQRLGLQVIVTAGSSPQPTLVYVPGTVGTTQAANVSGWVEERWIHVGASLVYGQRSATIQWILLGCVLLVCLGYFCVMFNAQFASQQRDITILSALGWRPQQLLGFFLAHAILMAIAGGIPGVMLALLIVHATGTTPFWPVVMLTFPMLFCLTLLCVAYPTWQLYRLRPAEVLRSGQALPRNRRQATSGMFYRWGIHFQARMLLVLACFFCSALLLTTMAYSLLSFYQSLQGTLLGNYILLQTGLLQLAGGTTALALTFTCVTDVLLLQVRERQCELALMQAVGWRVSLLQRQFLREGILLTLVSAFPGVLVACSLLFLYHATFSLALLAPALAIMLLLILLVMGATLPAIHLVSRIPLVSALRSS